MKILQEVTEIETVACNFWNKSCGQKTRIGLCSETAAISQAQSLDLTGMRAVVIQKANDLLGLLHRLALLKI
jgi:hypothetical protein